MLHLPQRARREVNQDLNAPAALKEKPTRSQGAVNLRAEPDVRRFSGIE
jgi:hypothetical protein